MRCQWPTDLYCMTPPSALDVSLGIKREPFQKSAQREAPVWRESVMRQGRVVVEWSLTEATTFRDWGANVRSPRACVHSERAEGHVRVPCRALGDGRPVVLLQAGFCVALVFTVAGDLELTHPTQGTKGTGGMIVPRPGLLHVSSDRLGTS